MFKTLLFRRKKNLLFSKCFPVSNILVTSVGKDIHGTLTDLDCNMWAAVILGMMIDKRCIQRKSLLQNVGPSLEQLMDLWFSHHLSKLLMHLQDLCPFLCLFDIVQFDRLLVCICIILPFSFF